MGSMTRVKLPNCKAAKVCKDSYLHTGVAVRRTPDTLAGAVPHLQVLQQEDHASVFRGNAKELPRFGSALTTPNMG